MHLTNHAVDHQSIRLLLRWISVTVLLAVLAIVVLRVTDATAGAPALALTAGKGTVMASGSGLPTGTTGSVTISFDADADVTTSIRTSSAGAFSHQGRLPSSYRGNVTARVIVGPVTLVVKVVVKPGSVSRTSSTETSAMPYPSPESSPGSSSTPTVSPTPGSTNLEGQVLIPVGSLVQAVVDRHPAGTTFILASGVHRLQSVQPRTGDVFRGEPGTVLNGSKLVEEYFSEGGLWFAAGQRQQGRVHGECRASTPLCGYPDTVFRNDQALRRVGGKAALSPETYYFDYAAGRIWFGADPRSAKIEAAVTGQAFSGAAADVTVRDLTVEKYATPAQLAAVDSGAGRTWMIDNVTARLNHGGGLRAGVGTTIVNSRSLANGQIGITGTGDGIRLENSEIGGNNTAGYEPGWEAGGSKFAYTTDLVARGNFVHHNDGPGLWTDIDNLRTLYEDNQVNDNRGEGIFHEISYAAVVRNNTVRRNGLSFSPWVWGAGIHVASSRDVEVYGNTVEGNGNGIVGSQQARGEGAYGARLLDNLSVHHNTVRDSGTVGVGQDVGDPTIFTTRGIRYFANDYRTSQLFSWQDRDYQDAATWRSFGQDVDGTWSG